MSTTQDLLAPGELVDGKYEVIQKLGTGGMGEVFLADDSSLDRKVALKFLPDMLQNDPGDNVVIR